MKIKQNNICRTTGAICIFFLLYILSACQKSTLLTYDRDSSIYFQTVAGSLADSIKISMGYYPPQRQDSTVRFVMRCTGVPVDYDRTINMTPDTGTTAVEGVHYTFLEQPVIPAGKIEGVFRIQVKRDISLKEKEHILRLKLLENEHFDTNISSEKRRYRILMSDIAAQPIWWHNNILGTFSLKKLLLMIDLLNVDASVTSISIDLLGYYGVFMQRYLNGMEAANTPIYDEDGLTPMVMGPSSQN